MMYSFFGSTFYRFEFNLEKARSSIFDGRVHFGAELEIEALLLEDLMEGSGYSFIHTRAKSIQILYNSNFGTQPFPYGALK